MTSPMVPLEMLRLLVAKGMSASDILAIAETAAVTISVTQSVTRDDDGLSANARRQKRFRDRKRSGTVTPSVTDNADDNAGNVTAVTNALPLPKPPLNPQTPTPTRGDIFTHARGADLIGLPASLRWAIAEQTLTAILLLRPSVGGYPCPPGVSLDQWKGFVQHRRQHKKGGPLNERAYLLLCNKLQTLAEDGHPPGTMIDLAIERGWITVFAPQEQRNSNNGSGNRNGGFEGDHMRDPVLGLFAQGIDP